MKANNTPINRNFQTFINLIIVIVFISFLSVKSDDGPASYNDTICVTYENLRAANYSIQISDYDSEKVFPENYCYGVLTYNITTEAYANIVNYNLEAFKRYRRFLNQYYLYNVTSGTQQISMNDGCLPIMRYLACFSVFNACKEEAQSFVENTVCESFCTTVFNRCGVFTNFGVCAKNSTEKYCAGVDPGSYLVFDFNKKIFIMLLLFFLIL